MRSYGEFEKELLTSAENLKRGLVTIIHNMGKIVAFIAGFVAILTTFTDVTFADVYTTSLLSQLILILICAYIIYFSLEDAGEALGKRGEEYLAASRRYGLAKEAIGAHDIEGLRAFCREYSAEELKFRKESVMLSEEITHGDIQAYRNGERLTYRKRRAVRRINRMRPIAIAPHQLLCRERCRGKSELSNPERTKIPLLLLKILPTTLCMTVTVSVIMNVKDGMSASDVISGIVKLAALPLIGFKGYSEGYLYAKNNLSLWLETKANLLERFLKNKSTTEDTV